MTGTVTVWYWGRGGLKGISRTGTGSSALCRIHMANTGAELH